MGVTEKVKAYSSFDNCSSACSIYTFWIEREEKIRQHSNFQNKKEKNGGKKEKERGVIDS